MPFSILSIREPLGEVAPVEAGQTYVFVMPVATRAGQIHGIGTTLFVVEETPECPHDEVSSAGHNWVCRTQYGESIWATLEQCISRGLLRLVPPPKALH